MRQLYSYYIFILFFRSEKVFQRFISVLTLIRFLVINAVRTTLFLKCIFKCKKKFDFMRKQLRKTRRRREKTESFERTQNRQRV